MTAATDFAREQMVKQQIRAGDVLDSRVLTTLQRVPREEFVPAAWRELAFADTEVALPAGQRMLSPVLCGRILQALDLQGDERVLEVGTGSGFLSACLAQLAASVHSLEIHGELVAFAQANLSAVGTRNVEVQQSDAFLFTAPAQGYDAIVLTGSLPVPDERFQRWLALGGRCFAVVGDGAAMEAQLIRRVDSEQYRSTVLFETQLAALEHARTVSAFRW